MEFSAFLPEVYRIVEDTSQIAWPNSAVARHANQAIRRVANATGGNSGRLLLNLVQGQQAYLLPISTVRRLTGVRILPENGTEPPSPLLQVNLDEIPVVSTPEAEPRGYSLELVGGAAENQFELNLWPAPSRSATDAIIVDHEIETVLTSADPAAGGDLTQNIPFPEVFELAIIYYTCASMLTERDDANDVRKANTLIAVSDEILRGNASVDSLQSYIDDNRAFP